MNEAQNVACPHCNGLIENDPVLAGQEVSCPHCDGLILMPGRVTPPPRKKSVPNNFDFDTTSPSQTSSANRLKSSTKKKMHFSLKYGMIAIISIVVLRGCIAGMKNDVRPEDGRTAESIVGGDKVTPQRGEQQSTDAALISKEADEWTPPTAPDFSNVNYSTGPQGEPISLKDEKAQTKTVKAHGFVRSGQFTWHGKVEFYDGGRKDGELYYYDGKPHGRSINWWHTGQKAVELTYAKGKKHGKEVEWDKEGRKMIEANYRDGVKDGPYLEWWTDGTPKLQAFYRNGQIDGQFVSWNSEGWKFAETYRNGELHGAFSYYRPGGAKAAQGRYINGIVIPADTASLGTKDFLNRVELLIGGWLPISERKQGSEPADADAFFAMVGLPVVNRAGPEIGQRLWGFKCRDGTVIVTAWVNGLKEQRPEKAQALADAMKSAIREGRIPINSDVAGAAIEAIHHPSNVSSFLVWDIEVR